MWKITFSQQIGSNKKRNEDALFNGQKVFQYRLKQAETLFLAQSRLIVGITDGVSNSPRPHLASRFWAEALEKCKNLSIQWCRQTHQQFCEAFCTTHLGTSTTLIAAQLDAENVKILNIGDSRAYKIKPSGEWQQLSEDHTLLNEWIAENPSLMQAVRNGQKFANLYNGLSDCLIADHCESDFKIYSTSVHLKQGESLLLCSDGLTDFIPLEIRIQIWQKYPTMTERLNAFRRYIKKDKYYDDLSIIVVEK